MGKGNSPNKLELAQQELNSPISLASEHVQRQLWHCDDEAHTRVPGAAISSLSGVMLMVSFGRTWGWRSSCIHLIWSL